MPRYESLGDRMKSYEQTGNARLIERTPKVIRIDGKAFHTYLKDAIKPYDPNVTGTMANAARVVLEEIGGTARFAFSQSDECSIVINDYISRNSQPWFDNKIQKVVSVAASVFTAEFNKRNL